MSIEFQMIQMIGRSTLHKQQDRLWPLPTGLILKIVVTYFWNAENVFSFFTQSTFYPIYLLAPPTAPAGDEQTAIFCIFLCYSNEITKFVPD